MADAKSINPWQRFLALPNESRTKTILVAFLVSTVCAVMVTGATVLLRPVQQANRAAEQQMRLETLLASIPGISDLMQAEGGTLSAVVIDLEEGAAASQVTPETLPAALEDPANWTQLPPERDTAGIGARPDLAQVYILRDGDRVSLLVLPVMGAGYNGPIQAMLALRGDMNTIAGLAINSQSETPGLGARIEEETWLAGFAGKRVADDRGDLRFTVARGPATTEFEVDGITGATRTSNAITRMIRFWVGPDGYGPLIEAVRRREF